MSLLRLSLPLLPLRRSLFTSTTQLSGHNKWSKIKEKKGANDLQKGAVYSKANRDIALAVRNGGGANPEHNATLAAVLKRVKSQGVPKDNIENAIKKAVGGKDKGDQHLTYEAMAPGSIGIIIECLSNNVNRTMHSLHNILKDHSARFAPVGFLFQRKGCVKVALDKGEDFDARTERLIEAALEAEAEDFEQVDTADDTVEIEFTCSPSALAQVTTATTRPGLCRELLSSELLYMPLEQSEALDDETERQVAELVDDLEENQDVLRVWTTLDT